MKKGFILDIDHAEIKSKQYMLDQGALTTPSSKASEAGNWVLAGSAGW